MKISNRPSRAPRTRATQRTQILAAFERSGLSAAAFARQHGLNYTTFCGWRQRRARLNGAPAFVQVELPVAAAPAGLVVELGEHARLRIESPAQIALAAQLLQAFSATHPC